jgi:hypothetical protein
MLAAGKKPRKLQGFVKGPARVRVWIIRETCESCYPAAFNLEVPRPTAFSLCWTEIVALLIVLSQLIMCA